MEQQEANGTNLQVNLDTFLLLYSFSSQNHVEHTPLLNNHQTNYPNIRQLQEQFAQTSLAPPPSIPLSPGIHFILLECILEESKHIHEGLSPIAKEERVTSPPSAFPPKTMLDEIVNTSHSFNSLLFHEFYQ